MDERAIVTVNHLDYGINFGLFTNGTTYAYSQPVTIVVETGIHYANRTEIEQEEVFKVVPNELRNKGFQFLNNASRTFETSSNSSFWAVLYEISTRGIQLPQDLIGSFVPNQPAVNGMNITIERVVWNVFLGLILRNMLSMT